MLSLVLFYLMERVKISEYTENLSDDAKKRYKLKLSEIVCEVDPYIDNGFEHSVELPGITYEQIYDYLVNSIHSSNSKQNAFKSLDAYHTVCASGWLSSLEVKEWKRGIIVWGDIKPSQRSGILYKAWVALKNSGGSRLLKRWVPFPKGECQPAQKAWKI